MTPAPEMALHPTGTTTRVDRPASLAELTIREFGAADSPRWDAFVSAHPHGTPFHLTAWKKSIEVTFGYRSVYLLAEEDGRIRGLLPLFLVQNILVGKALLSVPFAVYGGILAESAEVRDALAAHVKSLGCALGVQYVELRNAHADQCAGFSRVSRYVTFLQPIGPDEKAMLEAIPRKTRYMVRKALKTGFSARQQREDLGTFFDLYSNSLRRLGTPSFPRKHFVRLMENFGEAADVREVLLEGKVVSAVMSFYFRDQVLPYYGASDPAFNTVAPNNFMYFDLMCWAGKNGFRVFDFGRSKKSGGGSYDFKSHWGMVEKELPYEMLLVKRKHLPNYSPLNPVFQLPIKVWQRLPLPLTRAVGPFLLRLVP